MSASFCDDGETAYCKVDFEPEDGQEISTHVRVTVVLHVAVKPTDALADIRERAMHTANEAVLGASVWGAPS
jgi:hypothetical protein